MDSSVSPWTYTWDGENRLSAMETAPAAVTAGVAKQKLEFSYDAQGRRFSKKVYSWNGSAWVLGASAQYLYDGWNLLAELRLNPSTSTYDLNSSYAWGLDLSGSSQGAGGVGGLLFANSHLPTSSCHAPAYDGNGNVIGYVDMATGEKSATYEYGAFGETLVADGPMQDAFPFRFSTKYHDSETGFYNYGLRIYQPSTGRWLSTDPIEERGGANLYGFVRNAAIDHYDFVGMLLHPYQGDPKNIPLMPTSEIPPTADTGGSMGTKWEVLAASYGTTVRIAGRLSFEGKYYLRVSRDIWGLQNADDIKYSDRTGRTVTQHEHHHAEISIASWNAMIGQINRYEGDYCTATCAEIAAEIANQLALLARFENDLVQSRFDLDAYAENSANHTRFYKERGDTKSQLEKEKRSLLEVQRRYVNEGCSKIATKSAKL